MSCYCCWSCLTCVGFRNDPSSDQALQQGFFFGGEKWGRKCCLLVSGMLLELFHFLNYWVYRLSGREKYLLLYELFLLADQVYVRKRSDGLLSFGI